MLSTRPSPCRSRSGLVVHLLLGTLAAGCVGPAHAHPPASRPPVAAPAPLAAKERVVFDGRSQWNRVLVVDKDGLRSLYFGDSDGATQSTIALGDAKAVPMEYIRH